MNEVVPVELGKSDDRQLMIRWSDGQQQQIPFRVLRDTCPCASCRTDREEEPSVQPAGSLPILTEAQARPLDIAAMKPVGNYAYNIRFSDGHSTGIFTFELLRGLSGS